MPASIPELPNTFRYGASLCAHAVEGEDFASDWWHWEQRPGRIAEDATSEQGAGHWTRYREDAKLAGKLGLNAILISLSWARIVPEPGAIDPAVLTHYGKCLEAFRKNGVKPFVVLWDTAVPRWFAERGYWQATGACEDFCAYARATIEALKGQCRCWAPLAHPETWLTRAYEGRWPGGKGGWTGVRRARRHLAQACLETIRLLRECHPTLRAGHWLSVARQVPEDPNSPWDLRAARGMGGTSTIRFQEEMGRLGGDEMMPDFVIASDLETRTIRFSPFRPSTGFARQIAPPEPIPPTRFADLFKNLLPPDCPVYFHFQGSAAREDADRAAFLLDNLHGAAQARADGVHLRGCFCGPLLDGFEWTDGYTKRRGLVHVSRETLSRTPNPSAFLLRDIAAAQGITEGVVARHAPDWKPRHKES